MNETPAGGRLTIGHRGHVAWITIDNVAKHNAISLLMWRQLDELLRAMPEETRCIVLRGAGDKSFSSGADVSEFADNRRTAGDVDAYDEAADSAMQRLKAMWQPTVAMISGYCIGGGMALALSCDIRMAAENSQFAIPAARLGLGYGTPNIKSLLDVVSIPAAIDIMASARRLSAGEALRIGLVNIVWPVTELASEIERYVEQIARNAPLTVRAAKQTIRELSRLNPAADLDLCRRLTVQCFESEDYQEGLRSFREKREPRFSGK